MVSRELGYKVFGCLLSARELLRAIARESMVHAFRRSLSSFPPLITSCLLFTVQDVCAGSGFSTVRGRYEIQSHSRPHREAATWVGIIPWRRRSVRMIQTCSVASSFIAVSFSMAAVRILPHSGPGSRSVLGPETHGSVHSFLLEPLSSSVLLGVVDSLVENVVDI